MTSACSSFRQAARLSRRQVLRASGLALAGISPDLLTCCFGSGTSGSPASGKSFGRAKACILLFMNGGPAHQDTWDPKPEAPAEYRGEFHPIQTSVTGIHICEHFPRLARLAQHYAIVRSISYDGGVPLHMVSDHHMLTGRAPPSGDLRPMPKDWPGYGAVLARLGRGRSDLPPFVRIRPVVDGPAYMLYAQNSRGADAGWLGKRYEPFTVHGRLLHPDYQLPDLTPRTDLSPQRLYEREGLLRKINISSGNLEQGLATRAQSAQIERAFRLLASSRARQAFDVDREPDKVRDRYGRNLHGHSVLMARRLVEAGVPLVTVFWQNDGPSGMD